MILTMGIWESFPGGSDGKESACNAGDLGLIPGLGKIPREGNGNPLQYSCLENSMDRGAWWATCSPWGCKESHMTEQLTLLTVRLGGLLGQSGIKTGVLHRASL